MGQTSYKMSSDGNFGRVVECKCGIMKGSIVHFLARDYEPLQAPDQSLLGLVKLEWCQVFGTTAKDTRGSL